MSHYFSKKQDTLKSAPKIIDFTYKNNHLTFKSDYGVFSKNHVDPASILLLENVQIEDDATVLDLGCGYGPIGIALAVTRPISLTMSDVNERALALAEENARQNKVSADIVQSDGLSHISQRFDHIISNPPIRIGKESLYKIYENARTHLNKDGVLWLVMHKKHGAASAITFLRALYVVDVITKSKGFHVIKCQNSLTI